jgi:hypothetical protein
LNLPDVLFSGFDKLEVVWLDKPSSKIIIMHHSFQLTVAGQTVVAAVVQVDATVGSNHSVHCRRISCTGRIETSRSSNGRIGYRLIRWPRTSTDA